MDIYSHYKLSVKLPAGTLHEANTELDIIEDLRSSNEEASYAINEDGTNRDGAKWYAADEELKQFSQKYPGVVFVLAKESADPEEFGYGVIETMICDGAYV
mgnify:CR=1 FL=1